MAAVVGSNVKTRKPWRQMIPASQVHFNQAYGSDWFIGFCGHEGGWNSAWVAVAGQFLLSQHDCPARVKPLPLGNVPAGENADPFRVPGKWLDLG